MAIQSVQQPLIWAHRGWSGLAPENTLAAFRMALEAEEAGMELDVAMAADGTLVVIHDEDVSRTTDGTGLATAMSWPELEKLDAGSWFDPRFAGEGIPRLNDVLAEAAGRILINIELKKSSWRENFESSVEPRLLQCLRSHKVEESVLVSSFEWRLLRRLRDCDDSISLGILVRQGQNPREAVDLSGELGAFSIHPTVSDFLTTMPGAYHGHAGRIYPYTVRNAQSAESVLKSGADGFFADLPFADKK